MQSRILGACVVVIGGVWHYRNLERGEVEWKEPIIKREELAKILLQMEEEGVLAKTRE